MEVPRNDRKRLAIIDGKSVFYRGYYAMPNLSTKDGTPTGGVFGFATMALEVIRKLQPDYICVAWDKPKTNIRKRVELYPEYKAGRKPAPPDFYEQIPVLHKLLAAFGWPLYELDDYEADDIMATLAVQADKKGIETLLVTSDLDALQMVGDHIHVYALKKGLSNIELYKPESFKEKYGIEPTQFLDLKSLMGDSSDNIPGVPGVGQKTAITLLQEYKTLDGVYNHLPDIKETVRKKLEAGKDSAYLSKKLASLWTDAPIKLNLDELDGSKCDPEAVRNQLQELEFRSLVRQASEIWNGAIATEQDEPVQLKVGELVVIDSTTKLHELTLPKTKRLVVHSIAGESHGGKPELLSISPDSGITIVFDLSVLSADDVAKKLQGYMGSTSLIGYDLKATLQLLYTLGIEATHVEHDVLVGAFLVNSLRREQSLVELAGADLRVHLGDGVGADSEAETVSVIRALYHHQQKQLDSLPKVKELAKTIEWPIIPVLAHMEYQGITLDSAYLHELSDEIDDKISDLQQQIYGFADSEFNIGSPGQLAEILFKKLKLPTDGIKKGKTGYSTAASELDKLRGQHPIIDLITSYREVTKLKNTYVDTLPTMVDANGRVHTTYNLTIAQTGRLSSTDPNLQNIPVRTELGKRIRTAFVAGPGNVFVSADYSQFELRLAAYLCGDKELMRQFNEDIDVHTVTAAQVYGRDPEDVTKNMRRDAKVVNFGVMYGLSAHGLVAATGMTYAQAKEFIDTYFKVRPKLLDYIESVKKQARDKGYTETILGRRRPTPDVHSSNFAVREAAYRAAVNMPFQGSAADIMKKAMIDVSQKLNDDCKMLLQVHDSVLVECPEGEAKRVAKLLKTTMENVIKLPVKLTVDTTTGQNWGEL
ncbi:DNA polymerase I [Candidatus Saccharibacteria bacterium]|nr:DNA polymerase I [Candidatus Saccharibacteria bacterium]